ncbi:MAG: DNA repair protein RadC [Clostridiales Family XIII bacterium]|nr:DNA repair protein RadC [Clostridiales Family XIII bacterium]
MSGIKEMPKAERPREKLFAQGSAELSNTELLAILIGSGGKGVSAMALAEKVLALDERGMPFLSVAAPEELSNVPGIGVACACRIAAAVEIGKRLSRNRREKVRFGTPEDIAALFMESMRHETKEVFRILLLNAGNEMMGSELISIGNITGSIVDPRDVFKPAVKRGAASIVLVHNHPSGNPHPSDADISVTERIVEAGKILDVKVLDHLIIGDGDFISLKREQLM